MRTLSLFFRIAFVGSLGLVILALVGREISLLYARILVDNDVQKLQSSRAKAELLDGRCAEAASKYDGSHKAIAVQLRFLDSARYNLEVVCRLDEANPLLIESKRLPSPARRVAGSSGLYLPIGVAANTGVTLEVFGRFANIGVQEEGSGYDEASVEYPQTTCGGWGFVCCDSVTQVPSGDNPGDLVSDCRGSCYSQCKDRPSILSFRSDPVFNQETRTIQLNGTEAIVTFHYLLADTDGEVAHASLDYGDGVQETLIGTQGSVEHQYRCAAGGCMFEAVLSLIDNDGNTAPESPGNTIRVGM